jgi:hypothetical protein
MDRSPATMSPSAHTGSNALWWVKVLHTLAWAVFASAIVVVLVAVASGALVLAGWCSVLVWLEVAVLLLNGMRCPLTGVAARYTDDRSPNFDIFLPAWLAQYNKLLFGTVFVVSQFFLVARWLFS